MASPPSIREPSRMRSLRRTSQQRCQGHQGQASLGGMFLIQGLLGIATTKAGRACGCKSTSPLADSTFNVTSIRIVVGGVQLPKRRPSKL